MAPPCGVWAAGAASSFPLLLPRRRKCVRGGWWRRRRQRTVQISGFCKIGGERRKDLVLVLFPLS